MSFENNINSVEVTMNDLLTASESVQKLMPEDKNWEGRARILSIIFKGHSHKAMSVDARITALSAMIRSGKLPGWALPEKEDGVYSISHVVWLVAARESLKFTNNRPSFDEISFLQNVLSCSESMGNA